MFRNSHIVMFKSYNPNNMLGMVVYDDKTIIAIDGNFGFDSQRMIEYLKKLNRPVDYWIITHTHSDHIGAISEGILKKSLIIKNIVMDIPSLEQTLSLTRKDEALFNTVKRFYLAISKYDGNIIKPEIKKYKFGSFDIAFLKTAHSDNYFDLNCYSLVFSMLIEDKTLLVTSDILTDDSNKLVEIYGEKLKSDIVTVSHHGHGGASDKFYSLVSPSIALWPSIEECFYNIGPKGQESGPFESKRIRDILNKLNAKILASFIKDIVID